MRILYIDDTAYWRETYEKAFAEAEIIIKTLPDARGNILDEVSAFQPDLILLDISMPVVDGFEAIEILKNDSKTKNISVFFFSNISNRDYIKRGVELGAEKYLIKSDYEPENVVRIVKKYVQSKK